MPYADILFDNDYFEEEKIPGLRKFYIDYGIALLSNINKKCIAKSKNLEEVVKELEIENDKGNEEAGQLLMEIHQAQVLH